MKIKKILKRAELGFGAFVGVIALAFLVLFAATGVDNRLIGPEYQRDQMKYYPRARLEVIPDAGHSMFNENPEVTFQVIRKYLTQ